ncbi:reverse transcriptase [Polymorphobacter glacialis]|uniref:Reverse transcriptase n=1 Tax=Sandarakinorhabdus glacialis TaxID=1614636 RepID=A0A917A117_9SPHN|nr:RNA-directed DNA polymerase [Polymorphobacter glacialis]GGE21843.1 reverse transcriptase [Polymorphobacter glacialis]
MAAAKKLTFPRDVRLRRLISHGYFPSELPPPFTAEEYAKHSTEFATKWKAANIFKFWTAPETYSIPRYGHARRKLSIVNPINQLQVSLLIANNWVELKARLNRSKTSEFDPTISRIGIARAVSGVDFDGVARRRAEILGSYGRYVKTDIARFYPSVYTHSIAWAILGKDHCKANFQTPAFKAGFANELDCAVRAGQEGQTIGIPIGPDSSRIISELIAVEIEEKARSLIVDWDRRGVRYVDDMLIGLQDSETASAVLSGLSAALYDFQLDLNGEKTVTIGLGSDHAPEWGNYIRTFEMTTVIGKQVGDLDSYFAQSLYLADQNPRESVLLYATKRAATFAIGSGNRAHLVRWMLYMSRRSPNCLRFVAEHLAATRSNAAYPTSEINDFILQQIPAKAEAGHIDELAWLLFWAIEIKLKLPVSILERVLKLRSSVVALLTLDLRQQGLIDGIPDMSFWQSFATLEGLKSEMWLLSYEATRKKWWPKSQKTGFITGHQFFGDIWSKNIEFYNPKRHAKARVNPIFRVKPSAAIAFGSDYQR